LFVSKEFGYLQGNKSKIFPILSFFILKEIKSYFSASITDLIFITKSSRISIFSFSKLDFQNILMEFFGNFLIIFHKILSSQISFVSHKISNQFCIAVSQLCTISKEITPNLFANNSESDSDFFITISSQIYFLANFGYFVIKKSNC